MITNGRRTSDMSVVVVVTALPVPEHRAEVVAAFEARSPGFTANAALNATPCTRAATG
jgi:hypothetical protein